MAQSVAPPPTLQSDANDPSRSPAAATEPPPPAARPHVAAGLLLVVIGVVLLAERTGLLTSPWPAIPAAVLFVLGAAIVVQGARGVWPDGLVTVGVVLAISVGLWTAAVHTWDWPATGAGNPHVAPASTSDVAEPITLGAGNLTIDLTRLPLGDGVTVVRASVGVGELSVRVPSEVPLRIVADNMTGDIVFFGASEGGIGRHRTYTSSGYGAATRQLQLDLEVGVGRIEVVR